MEAIHPKKRREPVKVINHNGKEYKFYEVNFADEIMYQRYIMAEIKEMYIRFGLSESFIKQLVDIIEDKTLNTNDLKELKTDILAITSNLKNRIGMIAERRFYAELACVYFMLEDEPVEFDEEINRNKIKLWKESGEYDFFMLEAFKRTNASQNILQKDLLRVFQAVEERVKQIPELIHK